MAINAVSTGTTGMEIGTKSALGTQKQEGGSSETIKQVIEKEIKISSEKKGADELKQELKRLTDSLNKEMDPLGTSVRFGFDDKIEEMYVSVIDSKSNRVLRKIPSDEAIRLMAKMREITGMLFDKKA